MTKPPKETLKDPVTGKPLPRGVWYRGPGQYQARKMVNGKRHRKTFASANLARRWLQDVRDFRDAMLAAGLAKGNVVKRLNMIAAIVEYSNSEWDTAILNHASAKRTKRPEGADRKRNRRLKDGEEDELLRAASRSDGVFKHYPDVVWLIRWSIEQGCRVGESLSLRW